MFKMLRLSFAPPRAAAGEAAHGPPTLQFKLQSSTCDVQTPTICFTPFHPSIPLNTFNWSLHWDNSIIIYLHIYISTNQLRNCRLENNVNDACWRCPFPGILSYMFTLIRLYSGRHKYQYNHGPALLHNFESKVNIHFLDITYTTIFSCKPLYGICLPHPHPEATSSDI